VVALTDYIDRMHKVAESTVRKIALIFTVAVLGRIPATSAQQAAAPNASTHEFTAGEPLKLSKNAKT
jgi:hypothetical protein